MPRSVLLLRVSSTSSVRFLDPLEKTKITSLNVGFDDSTALNDSVVGKGPMERLRHLSLYHESEKEPLRLNISGLRHLESLCIDSERRCSGEGLVAIRELISRNSGLEKLELATKLNKSALTTLGPRLIGPSLRDLELQGVCSGHLASIFPRKLSPSSNLSSLGTSFSTTLEVDDVEAIASLPKLEYLELRYGDDEQQFSQLHYQLFECWLKRMPAVKLLYLPTRFVPFRWVARVKKMTKGRVHVDEWEAGMQEYEIGPGSG
jgi:hypothetical protein